MFFWRNRLARLTTALCMRSWELPGTHGSLCIRFASASYCANASSRRLRAAEASGVGRSCLLFGKKKDISI